MLPSNFWSQAFDDLHKQSFDNRLAFRNMYELLKGKTVSLFRIELDASLLGTTAVAELENFTFSLEVLLPTVNNLMFSTYVQCVLQTRFEKEFMGQYLIDMQYWLMFEEHHYENDTAALFYGTDGVVAGMGLSARWRSEVGNGEIVAPRAPSNKYAVPHVPREVHVAPEVLQLLRKFFI